MLQLTYFDDIEGGSGVYATLTPPFPTRIEATSWQELERKIVSLVEGESKKGKLLYCVLIRNFLQQCTRGVWITDDELEAGHQQAIQDYRWEQDEELAKQISEEDAANAECVKYLLDTDHLSLFVQNDPMVVGNVAAHRKDTLAISVVTVEEQLLGWLAEVRKTRDRNKQEAVYRRMASCFQDLSGWSVVPYTVPAMQRFDALVKLRINIGRNDMKIAAIALEEGATVATRNAVDFSRVPGLSIVDWSK